MKRKITRKVTEEIEIKKIEILISMREIADHTPAIPESLQTALQSLGKWRLLVEIDTGKIENWPADAGALDLYCKPRDSGTYRLISPDNKEVAIIDGGYVPNGIIPGDYGDYIGLKIRSDGVIENWPTSPDVSEFFKDEDDD